MDETQIKHVIEAALLAAGRPLTLERLGDLFTAKGSGIDRATLKRAVEALSADYEGRGIEIAEIASGYRVQVKRSMSDWLIPLWEERAPRYTRALLETLALIAYRQPITRAEIEEVRGVVVSTNIMRTLLERSWVRVVGHRDVPGKPAMFGTTREFLDYFGLKKLEDLPTLAELKDGLPELSPQTDLIDSLEAEARGESPPAVVGLETLEDLEAVAQNTLVQATARDTGARGNVAVDTLGEDVLDDAGIDDPANDDGADDVYADSASDADSADFEGQDSSSSDADDSDDTEAEAANVVPLRAGAADTERNE
jgi:segregation and condensation protein B